MKLELSQRIPTPLRWKLESAILEKERLDNCLHSYTIKDSLMSTPYWIKQQFDSQGRQRPTFDLQKVDLAFYRKWLKLYDTRLVFTHKSYLNERIYKTILRGVSKEVLLILLSFYIERKLLSSQYEIIDDLYEEYYDRDRISVRKDFFCKRYTLKININQNNFSINNNTYIK